MGRIGCSGSRRTGPQTGRCWRDYGLWCAGEPGEGRAATIGLDPIALYPWQVPVKNEQCRGVPRSAGDVQTEWQPLPPAQGAPPLDKAFATHHSTVTTPSTAAGP